VSDFTFGEWLKRQRKAAGLTQEQLAQQVGCAAITLRKIEAEERRPSEQIAARLAEIFDIPPNEQKNFLKFVRGSVELAPAAPSLASPWNVSAASARIEIPATVTSLVGRVNELTVVREYLQQSDTRLVTLIGPPGIGKTRLSIAAARDAVSMFPDGVFFIALAPLEDPSLILPTIFQTLGYTERDEQSAGRLVKDIAVKNILLILDNAEHLLNEVAALVSRLLSACPHLKMLITSREALRVPGEWLYPVPTLTLPLADISIDVNAVTQFPALTLFVERARAARPDFKLTPENIQAVASICMQLDGLPLAIELIAARIHFMSPQTLLERMTSQFVLSADGMRAVSARQKTLNNAIGWSYNSLSPEEQKMFGYLSVFSGGFTLEAAEKIFSDLFTEKSVTDLVALLSDKSLLQRGLDERGEIRFNMLVTIQEFAVEHLHSMGEDENARDRHLQYFVQFSEQAGRELIGPQQMEWRACLLEERDNLRAALGWAARNNPEEGMSLASNLGYRFWENFNIQEGVRWLTEFLQKTDSLPPTKTRVRALCVLGFLQLHFQRFKSMRASAEDALALSRALGDAQGECDSLNLLGSVMQFLEGMDQKTNLQTQSLMLAKAIGDVWREAEASSALSWDKRDLRKAFAYRERSIQLYRQVGDWQGLAHALSVFASDVALVGDVEHAQSILGEYAGLHQLASDKRNLEFILTTKARIALLYGEYEQACSYLEENMAILQELGNRMGYLWARTRLGYVILREGKSEAAKEIILECLKEFQNDGNRAGLLFPLELMAMYFVQADQYELAARLIGWTEAVHRSIGDSMLQIVQSDWVNTTHSILAKLGEDAFHSLREEGSTMTLDGIVAYAMSK